MLIEITIKNFRSISERQTLSLAAGQSSAEYNKASMLTGNSLAPSALRSCCLFGANAAGKSSFVEAIKFLSTFVEASAKDRQINSKIDTQPFVFDPAWRHAPTALEITFVYKSVLYQYGFVADQKRIHQEWLYQKPLEDGTRIRKVFSRSLTDTLDGYDWYLNRALLSRESESWKKNTRPNALFLSTAVQLNSEELRMPYEWLVERLRVVEDASRLSNAYSVVQMIEGDRKNDIIDFLGSIDIPLEGIEIDVGDFDPGELPDKLPREIIDSLEKELKGKKVIKEVHTTRLDSVGQKVNLSIENESSGTQILFSLSGPLLDTLQKGNTLIIDELQNNLHPLALDYLINLFASSKSNAHGAQLVFTSHNSSILDNACLHRDQIWFVSKNSKLSTSAVPLSSFKDRRLPSLQKAYLNGRFGAVPIIDDVELD